MRIVAVADTHTFHDDLHGIPDGDVFIHAGDLCRAGRLDELRGGAAWLRALPHRHKVVVAGNHDWCFAREPKAAIDALGPGVVYLQDAEAVLEGVRFWGSPWQPEFNDWAFNLPRGAALASRWGLIPTGVHVLVTHGPPRGVGDRCDYPVRRGCHDLREAVRRVRPLLHIFGHIHQDGGFWREDDVCYANVTTWEGLRGPTVVDLDVVSGQVVAVSVPPAE
jgi:predicted phosphohydrolase